MLWLDELRQRGIHDVLELGSNPYFLSLLIQEYFPFNLQLDKLFIEPLLMSPNVDDTIVNTH